MTSSTSVRPVHDVTAGRSEYIAIGILFLVNLLNYMDRYTIAGVLTDIQTFYSINDAQAGLLQTVFIGFFMICSPVCGFLGDRYNRKYIMVTGMLIWILAVLASTFVPADKFWLFMLIRGVVGVGEASYATISPTIIADMFSGSKRSTMLMIFYFAIPVGCGCGFMVGSTVSSLLGQWQWGIRITSVLGAISVLLVIFFVEEPERGKADREHINTSDSIKSTSYWTDIKSLLSNTTYLTSTYGYTAIVFAVGTMSWWVPSAIIHKDAWKAGLNSTDALDNSVKSRINLIFGVITCIGGIAGVAIGSITSSLIKGGVGPFKFIQTSRSDALVCALGAMIGIPTFFTAIRCIPEHITVTWVMMLICITALCFNWATNVDMQMNVVIPQRRNTANSYQILISHLCGDASGPYIVGLISDKIRGNDDSPFGNFSSLLKAFYLPNTILVISAILFMVAAFTFVKDHKKFLRELGAHSIHMTGKENGAFTAEINIDSVKK